METALFTLALTGIFWAAIYVVYQGYFYAEPPVREDPEKRKDREKNERYALLQDLLQNVTIVEIKAQQNEQAEIKKILEDPEKFGRNLTDLGVAENRTAVEEDEKTDFPEEHWVCDNRPLWFIPSQFLLSWGGAALFSLMMPVPLAAIASFILVTLFIGLTSLVQVDENERIGVKRFGKQLGGYLSSGWQFLILPTIIEKPEVVTMKHFVWGPRLSPSDDTSFGDDFHLKGALGTNGNPTPGKFNVYLHGAWPIEITILVTLRVRQSSKIAWWRFLNSYASEEEIGEQIAGVVLSVLTTYAREVEEETEKEIPDKAGQEKAEKAVKSLLVFLNRMPEISGKILLAMQELGRSRIAGILPVSVAIAEVAPGVKFLELRQSLDQAKMDRLKQQIDAEGTKRRLEITAKVLGAIPKEQREQLIRLEELDTQRSFAGRASGIETIASALGLNFTQQGVNKK